MLTFQASDVPEVFAAQVLFWILLPFVLLASPRWAVLAWLIMGNLDATGSSELSSAGFGIINAVKGIVLPLYLWWRLRKAHSEVCATPPAKLWLILTVYAAFAALWSPFPIPAVKLVGDMVGLLLSLIVIERSVRLGLLRTNTLALLIVASLGLGVLQTYYYQGTQYAFDGLDQPLRFSSFIAAQQYGAYLVAFLAIILWLKGFSVLQRNVLGICLCIALVLNGSRTWFFGATVVLMLYLWLSARKIFVLVTFGAATISIAVLLLLNLTRFDLDVLPTASSRVFATISAIVTGEDTANNTGLRNLSFRLAIYNGVLEGTQTSSARQILFGHGTSSGGDVALQVFPSRYRLDRLDANRTIHNEWLRAFYEWGILGLVLWASIFGTLFVGLLTRYRNPTTRSQTVATLSFLPAFLAASATENIVASAGNAVTLSLTILIALLWQPPESRVRHRESLRVAA
jgi:O-antigen ligase